MAQQSQRATQLFIAEDWQAAYQAFKNINFQSYSYTTIKTAMLNYIQQNYPEDFTDYSENSEFMFIVDLLAYLGEVLAYRTELNARDNILDTAQRKESILNLVKSLNYNMHRNLAASGLVKLMSVSTTQSVLDSNGTDLSNRIILWNDPSNADWYEQFILVMNSSFISTNYFGNPVQSAILNNVDTQLYEFNNITGLSAADAFSIPVSGQAMDFEIINTNFNSTIGFYEINPDQNVSKHVLYLNDGSGNDSVNTGFFFMFKQGTLRFEDYLFDLPIENRQITLAATGINDSDVWVQQVDDNGNSITNWTQVSAFENIVANSIPAATRNIFSVITGDNDTITICFSDGRLGTIPTGGFRFWYRTSNGLNYTIRPVDMRGIVISIPYTVATISNNNQSYSLSLNFSLQQSVVNSLASETIDSAQQNAPLVYYSQNRMTNNQDYNTFPLSLGQSIIKLKAINRTYSGHSQYIDILDPTKNYSSTIEFGDDGVLYQEPYQYVTTESLPTSKSATDIVQGDVFPLLLSSDYQSFFYANMTNFVLTNFYWGLVTSSTYTSTGFLTDSYGSPQQVGIGLASAAQYIGVGSLLQFVNPQNNTQFQWATVISVVGNGTQFSANNDGAITLSENIPDGWVATQTYAPFRNTFTPVETLPITTQIQNNNTFAIRYDLPTASWIIVSSMNIDSISPFSLAHAGDQTNENLDASWIILAQYSSTSWTFTTRYLRYVFESVETSRFFFSADTKAVDLQDNVVNYDTITILKFNTQPSSGAPLGKDYPFQVTQAIRYADGYTDNMRIEVSPAPSSTSNTFLDPNEFAEVVAPSATDATKYIFQQQFTDAYGFSYYQTMETPNITEFANPSSLLAHTGWSNGNVSFVLSTQQFFNYIDGTITPITVNQSASTLTINNHGLTTGSNAVLFVGPPPASPPPQVLPSPLATARLYYVYVIDANTIALGTSLANVTSSSPQLVLFSTPLIGTISMLSELTQTGNYRAFLGRKDLNYSYEHFSDQDERIDPSITNVIDMYVLTSGYYNQILAWKTSQSTDPLPAPPTTYQLGQQFSVLQNYKMASDELIFQPAQFKILFGQGADPELMANFMVVPSQSTTATNNEIAQQVITCVDSFFDISQNRFDFGETFYFSELSAYIHQQLSSLVASVVIVPQYGTSKFGDLFQIRCGPTQLFLSTATVQNVQIVSNLTDSVLRS